MALYEVMRMTTELQEIVVTNPTEGKIREEAKRQGMLTMREDGVLKALDGIISINEVLRETEGE